MSAEDFDDLLERAFVADLPHRVARVESLLRELGRASDTARRDELAKALALEAHNLKGTALTLRLGDVEQLAEGLELLARRIALGNAALTRDDVERVTAALRSLASARPDADTG